MLNRLILAVIPVMMQISCESGKGDYYTVQGFTQGTSYRVTYQHRGELPMKERVDSVLRTFDLSLSAYEPESVISRINQNREGVRTDSFFRTLFRESARIYQQTGGAFDITLGPVINAWGFGPGAQVEVDSALVDSLLQYVGMEKVALAGDSIWKSHPAVQLNVNAIAQGYAVDVVGQFLASLGCRNYMVEIGGEIRTRGVNPKGSLWRIGVDRPEFGSMIPGRQLEAIIRMNDRSLATSGNYRKFYEKNGIRITHSIDPATGFPRESRLLSATVLTDDCMTADAFATACMVMGLDRARAFVEEQKHTDAFFIYGDDTGAYQVWYTDGLRKYLEMQ